MSYMVGRPAGEAKVMRKSCIAVGCLLIRRRLARKEVRYCVETVGEAMASVGPAFVVSRALPSIPQLRTAKAPSAKASGCSFSQVTLGAAVVASGLHSRRFHNIKRTASPGTTVLNKAEKLQVPRFLLDGVDIFIFDCDGVIWRGDSVIPGIPQVIDKLRADGKTLFFVTNNSTKSRAGYKSKFTSLGLDVQPEEIFSSSFAAAAYLEQTKFKESGKKVYIIGEKGISEELDLVGIPWLGGEGDKGQAPNMGSGGKVDIDHDVGAVVVSFDRHINYYKLQYAQLCLNELPGCEFIATNMDRVTHLTDAQEWAGNGTMVGAVSGCTGRDPTVVGKPAPLMIDYIAQKYGISDRSRICMVGDRLDTDIAFGRNNGLKTCLTLSGVTSEDELMDRVPRKKGTEGIQPEFYVDTICDFYGIRP